MTTATRSAKPAQVTPTPDPTQAEVFLNDHVVLICPTLSIWQGQYQLPTEQLKTELADQEIDADFITTPRAVLLNQKSPVDASRVPWKKRFSAVENALSKLKDTYTIPFTINGIRILPRHKLSSFMDEVYGTTVGQYQAKLDRGELSAVDARNIERLLATTWSNKDAKDSVLYPASREKPLIMRLNEMVDEFCGSYSQILEQLATSPVWAQVAHKVPKTADVMRTKFSLNITPIELASGSITKGSLDEMLTHTDIVRSACRQHVTDAVESMISAPRQEVAKAVKDLRELIARNGQITTASFKPLQRAIEKLKMFEFVASPDLKAQIETLQKTVSEADPAELRGRQAMADLFSEQLRDLTVDISSDQAIAQAVTTFAQRRGRAIGLSLN